MPNRYVGWVKRFFERRPTSPSIILRHFRWVGASKATLDPPYRTVFVGMMFWVLLGCYAIAQVAPPIPSLPGLPKVAAPDTPPDMPPDAEENPLKIAERALTNAKDATEKLANQDAGDETQAAQKRTLKAIDDLLKKSENPPPMGGGGGGGSPPPPMGGGNPPPPMGGGSGGGGGGSPPPMGGGGKPMGNGKPMPMGSGQPMPMQGGGQPMPMGSGQPMPMPGGGPPMGGQQPMPGGTQPMGGGQLGQGGAKSPPGVPLPEKITKDVWGHLPSQLRQQMSQFYRERFMPKYSELLRQYYSSLAEKEKEKEKK